MNAVLYVTLEVVRIVEILARPLMPTSAAKVLDALGQTEGPALPFEAIGTPIISGTIAGSPYV